jgi:hypothetical protein
MSASPADEIHANLQGVARERAARQGDAALDARVTTLKAYQQQRFARTYADMLASARYGAAARFFLEELYGPGDFTRRDAQFARVVPALVRLFPKAVVQTVVALTELHALTESLDTAMAAHASVTDWTPARYQRAWQQTGRVPDRETQIALTLAVAAELDALTRKPLLRKTLHLMRGPARAAGLSELQHFLETGFDTFAARGGAEDFIGQVATRERMFAAAQFAADPPATGD